MKRTWTPADFAVYGAAGAMIGVLIAHLAKGELVDPREILQVGSFGGLGAFLAGWLKSRVS